MEMHSCSSNWFLKHLVSKKHCSGTGKLALYQKMLDDTQLYMYIKTGAWH